MDEFDITCPYCGEHQEILIEDDVRGEYVQDCEVCCKPWLVRVRRSVDGVDLQVDRADGTG